MYLFQSFIATKAAFVIGTGNGGISSHHFESPKSGFSHFIERYWWVLMILLLVLLTIAIGITYMKRNSKSNSVTIHLVGREDLSVSRGSKPILPMQSRPGYAFRGWFLDSACTMPFDSRKPIKRDLILYPKWEKEVG